MKRISASVSTKLDTIAVEYRSAEMMLFIGQNIF